MRGGGGGSRGSNHCCLLGKMELETGSPMINAKMLARSRAEVLVVPAPAIKIVMEFACERWPKENHVRKNEFTPPGCCRRCDTLTLGGCTQRGISINS